MSRTITLIATVGAALAVAAPASGQGQPVEPQWMQALEARSQELNRQHGLGDYTGIRPDVFERRRSEAGRARREHAPELARSRANDAPRARHATSRTCERRRPSRRARRSPRSGVCDSLNENVLARERATARPRTCSSVRSPRGHGLGEHFIGSMRRANEAFARERRPRAGRVRACRAAGRRRHRSRDGREIEWPQIGFGVGIGILLAAGLMLALRATRATAAGALSCRCTDRGRHRPADAAALGEGGRGASGVNFRACETREAVPQELLASRTQRTRAPAGAARAHRAAHASPHRPRPASGKLWSTPVSIVAEGGERWLVAPYGARNWVKNARAAGWVRLRRGSRDERLAVEELDPEEAVPVLKRYYELARVTRPFFDATLASSDEEWLAEAPRHPVFRLGKRREQRAAGSRRRRDRARAFRPRRPRVRDRPGRGGGAHRTRARRRAARRGSPRRPRRWSRARRRARSSSAPRPSTRTSRLRSRSSHASSPTRSSSRRSATRSPRLRPSRSQRGRRSRGLVTQWHKALSSRRWKVSPCSAPASWRAFPRSRCA